MTNLIGQSLGRYHILEQLGEGGMAIVYKAYDTRLERDVAIKIIRRGAFPPDQLERILKRFEREAKALAKLSHLHIVKVLDFGEHEGSPYLVMEYLPGGTLKERLGQSIPWQEAVRILTPIAEALDYAHEHGIVHRDIKPSNILLTEKGQPMLTDFGIAKILETDETASITSTGIGVGTPEYMAPEQWTGQSVAQSDIYSLGVVLYEMVAGRKPYIADTPAAILLKQATDPLPRPGTFVRNLPEVMEKVLLKALARKPQDRYQSMAEFGAVLERLIGEGNSRREVFGPSKPVKPRAKRLSKSYGLAIAGIVGVMIIVGLLGFFMSQSARPNLQTDPTATDENLVPTPTSTLQIPLIIPSTEVGETLPPITITLWHAYGPDTSEGMALQKILKDAQVDLPNIKVAAILIPYNEISTKYQDEVSAGNGPDMFIVPNDWLGEHARAGLIADITDLASGDLARYSSLAINGMSVDGKLYGIPESFKGVVFWYDKTIIKSPPASMASLKTIMQAGTPISISYGCYHHWGFYGAFGGQIFDENWRFVADQSGVTEAMTYLDELYQISRRNGWPTNDGDGLVPFSEGQVAAITNGNWAMNDYRNALGDKLAVAPLPAGPGGPSRPMLGVDGFYFNPNSQRLQSAVRLALYLTGQKAQVTMMNEAGHVPVNTTVSISDPLISGLVKAFQTGYLRPQVPQLSNYWANFCSTDDVFQGNVLPADWVKSATENANR